MEGKSVIPTSKLDTNDTTHDNAAIIKLLTPMSVDSRLQNIDIAHTHTCDAQRK